jgi:anaerobic sulfite reductase subunit C
MKPAPGTHGEVEPAPAQAPIGAEIEFQACRAATGCPNAVGDVAEAAGRLEALMLELDTAAVVRSKARRPVGPLLSHQKLKLSLSGCANCCSQPQIADAALVAQLRPEQDENDCDSCGACVDACREEALRLHGRRVLVDRDACLACGACVRACPTGAMQGHPGWRVLAGGRLGRHPRLAVELASGVSLDEARELVGRVVRVWDEQGLPGERVGATLERQRPFDPVAGTSMHRGSEL